MRGGAICIPQPNSRDPRAAGSCGTRHPGLPLPTGAVPELDKPSPRRLLEGVAPFAPQPAAGYVPPHPQGSSKPPSPGDGAPPARPHAASCFLCTFLFCKHHLPARLDFAGVIRQVLFGVTAFAALLGHVQQPCPEPSRMRPPLPSRSPPRSPRCCAVPSPSRQDCSRWMRPREQGEWEMSCLCGTARPGSPPRR